MQSSPSLVKIATFGNSFAGKTSLLFRYANSCAPATNPQPTCGVDFMVRHWPEGNIRLQLWDTSGQERFYAISRTYFRVADAVALVYDLADDEYKSLQNLGRWYQQLWQWRSDAASLPLIVIGNKLDIVDAPKEQLIPQWCAERQLRLFYCSALSGNNVQCAFDTLVRSVIENRQVREQETPPRPDLENNYYEYKCCY